MPSTGKQRDVLPTRMKLRRIEPARNMRRFYLMQVQPDLFGGASLIREWGRAGRVLVEHHANESEAVTALLAMARVKGRRGYVA